MHLHILYNFFNIFKDNLVFLHKIIYKKVLAFYRFISYYFTSFLEINIFLIIPSPKHKVIIDTKLVNNYKVSGTISKKENKDFYVVRYTKTNKGYNYKVCLDYKERDLIYVLNGNINIEHKIYDYLLNGYGRGYMLYGDVLVRYVDKNGKEISKNDYFYDRVNNSYSTNPKDLTSKGYVYTSLYTISKDGYGTSGKFINDRIIITYIYDKDKVHTVQTGVDINNGYLISLGISSLGLVSLVFLKKKFS